MVSGLGNWERLVRVDWTWTGEAQRFSRSHDWAAEVEVKVRDWGLDSGV